MHAVAQGMIRRYSDPMFQKIITAQYAALNGKYGIKITLEQIKNH
jgi:hypothetical protein